MSRAIQLSLFPARGFALRGAYGALLEDMATGAPVVGRTTAEINRARWRLPGWMRSGVTVVPVEIHDDSDDEGRPTYVVLPQT